MNHILNEVVQRLRGRGTAPRSLIKQLGIDPDAEPGSPPDDLELRSHGATMAGDGEILRGEIPFDMEVVASGHHRTLNCRVRFAATLHDDTDRRTGAPIRVIARLDLQYEVLRWDISYNECPASVPHWAAVPLEALLPERSTRAFEDLIEEAARALEQSTA